MSNEASDLPLDTLLVANQSYEDPDLTALMNEFFGHDTSTSYGSLHALPTFPVYNDPRHSPSFSQLNLAHTQYAPPQIAIPEASSSTNLQGGWFGNDTPWPHHQPAAALEYSNALLDFSNNSLLNSQSSPNDSAGHLSQAENKRKRDDDAHILHPPSNANNFDYPGANEVPTAQGNRAPQACFECRKAKQRCKVENTLPCTRCKAMGKQCAFIEGVGRGRGSRNRKSSTAAGLKRSPEESPTASQVAQDLYQTPEHNNPSPSRVIGALHTQAQGQTLPSIPESDADQLFKLFFETLNVRWGLLQREMHTPAFCQKVSPFLYNTVAFIASCYSISHVGYRKHLAEVVRTQAFSIGLIGIPQIETVQAFLLLSLWGTGYGRRDEHDFAWMMISFAARMALDIQLYHTRWHRTKHHNAERTWLLCWVIDRTKSSQRGRIPSIQVRCDEQIQRAQEWIAEEPDCLLLVFYAELLNVTGRTLDLLSSLPRNAQESDNIIRIYKGQTTPWLSRYRDKSAGLSIHSHLDQRTQSYMSYLAEFYVSYWTLAVLSFGLQNALEARTSDLSGYVAETSTHALRILESTAEELGRDSPVRSAPDGHFEFVLHAAVLLMKIDAHLSDASTHAHRSIQRVADLMADISKNQRDTPALYAGLLYELSRTVQDLTRETQTDSLFGPVITQQTKQFAHILYRSAAWKNVVLPGLNAASVEAG